MGFALRGNEENSQLPVNAHQLAFMACLAGEPIGKYFETADLTRHAPIEREVHHALSNGLGQQRGAGLTCVEPGPDAVQWPGSAQTHAAIKSEFLARPWWAGNRTPQRHSGKTLRHIRVPPCAAGLDVLAPA